MSNILLKDKSKERKKMKKAIAAVLSSALIIAICVMMSACSTSIVGTWKFYSMTYEQENMTMEIKAGESFQGVTIKEDAFVLTINDDGSLEFKMSLAGQNQTVNGTWEEKDGKYYLTIEGDTQEVTVSGGKLTMENEGAKLILKK